MRVGGILTVAALALVLAAAASGAYSATWFYGGTRLGPPLTFALANR